MEELYRILRTGHVQTQGIVDTIADPMVVLDSSLCVQNASRSFFETFQVFRDETIGQRLTDLGNGQWNIPELQRLLGDVIPKSTAVINYEVTHDFPSIGRRTMLLTARTLFHPDGASHSLLLVFSDATDRMARDRAKDMLFGELRHRMKNLLGVVQSLARQTPIEGRTAEEYRDSLLGRLGALIDSEDLAFAEQGELGVEQLLERTFAPYASGGANTVIEPGPPVQLGPRTVMSLSLVLHELTTNAAKYGALSDPEGQVRVRWQVEDGKLHLHWAESGGPAVSAPTATGYGTQLIQSTVSYNLGGTVELDYPQGGFQAEIVVPLGTASQSE